ncbi:unnamed protein product [Linum trigynum]|uniref:Uncharacterized protein n=1 Tax=Linum trigynum TaxID=586398 RepID=A0AAV2DWS3_9ROSI
MVRNHTQQSYTSPDTWHTFAEQHLQQLGQAQNQSSQSDSEVKIQSNRHTHLVPCPMNKAANPQDEGVTHANQPNRYQVLYQQKSQTYNRCPIRCHK